MQQIGGGQGDTSTANVSGPRAYKVWLNMHWDIFYCSKTIYVFRTSKVVISGFSQQPCLQRKSWNNSDELLTTYIIVGIATAKCKLYF